MVSIIIINYNTFQLTVQCISSILTNDPDLTAEIILVDNGSSECPSKLFKEMFPQIILIESKVNVGFAKGCNLGIAASSGEFILLLNSDTILIDNAISKTVAFLNRNERAKITTCRLEFSNGVIQHNCQRFPSIKYLSIELFRLQKIFPRLRTELMGGFFSYDTLVYPDWIWGTYFLFKRELLLNLPEGKLAENFFLYGEDMQWCMEFRNRGFEIAFFPDAKLIHFVGASGAPKNSMMKQNYDTFLKLYYPPWKRWTIRLLSFLLTI